ncbi:unnamed protein product [Tetraodon nigroviridis]|uniref:(spotted green pufferfish) hypothetical protein n=1 Tax=Tetraodon nigroviridis TaxID=99883 RepID=Q4SS85_TETNG|nr:unnamed protein product [Tetraodon nigroviridis]
MGQAGFHFNFFLDRVNVDWQSINAVDIDLLMRQVDVRALQEHIRDVTFCCLEGVQCQQCLTPVDPTFVKLFRLAQLSLQWLDYCQKMIVFNMNTMEKKLKKSDTECKKLQAKSKEQEQKMKQMVSELKARRNIIQKQQSMFAKDMSSSVQCQHCDKKYINGFFLQEHMLRRHPSQCQNCECPSHTWQHLTPLGPLNICFYLLPVTHQIGQKNPEIESLKLEISSLRTQMAQTAETSFSCSRMWCHAYQRGPTVLALMCSSVGEVTTGPTCRGQAAAVSCLRWRWWVGGGHQQRPCQEGRSSPAARLLLLLSGRPLTRAKAR